MFDLIEDMVGGIFHFVGEAFEELSELPRHALHDDEAAFVLCSVVLLLAGTAVGIGWYTWRRSRPERATTSTWSVVRGLCSSAAGLLWLLPVVAVFALHGLRSFENVEREHPGTTVVVEGAAERHDIENIDELHGVVLEAEAPAEDAVATAIPVVATSWIDVPRIEEEGRSLVTVSGQRFATPDEAERAALEEARTLIHEDARRSDFRLVSPGALPLDVVKRIAVRRTLVEGPIRHTTAKAEFDVYRVHLQVELSDEVRRETRPYWRSVVVARRLAGLGGMAGFLTLAFGTLTVYLRLDDLSGGKYRNRLRFAAASLVTAGGLVAAVLL